MLFSPLMPFRKFFAHRLMHTMDPPSLPRKPGISLAGLCPRGNSGAEDEKGRIAEVWEVGTRWGNGTPGGPRLQESDGSHESTWSGASLRGFGENTCEWFPPSMTMPGLPFRKRVDQSLVRLPEKIMSVGRGSNPNQGEKGHLRFWTDFVNKDPGRFMEWYWYSVRLVGILESIW